MLMFIFFRSIYKAILLNLTTLRLTSVSGTRCTSRHFHSHFVWDHRSTTAQKHVFKKSLSFFPREVYEFPLSQLDLAQQTLNLHICRYDSYSRRTSIGDVFLALAELSAQGIDFTREVFLCRNIISHQEVGATLYFLSSFFVFFYLQTVFSFPITRFDYLSSPSPHPPASAAKSFHEVMLKQLYWRNL